jgi:hypothetical protein
MGSAAQRRHEGKAFPKGDEIEESRKWNVNKKGSQQGFHALSGFGSRNLGRHMAPAQSHHTGMLTRHGLGRGVYYTKSQRDD